MYSDFNIFREFAEASPNIVNRLTNRYYSPNRHYSQTTSNTSTTGYDRIVRSYRSEHPYWKWIYDYGPLGVSEKEEEFVLDGLDAFVRGE